MQHRHDSAQPGGDAAVRRGGRGAPLKPLIDRSPLDGPASNAGVRIGLLLRLHRFCDRKGRYPRQADLLDALLDAGHHATTTALSRAESGAYRSSAVLRGYEDVLGLEDGSLRAVADFLCRRQGGAPADRDPAPEPVDVHTLSELSAAVQRSDPSPSAWWAFARAFRRPDTRGLPVATMATVTSRLREVLRESGGLAWVMGIEAMLLLGEGPYAGLARDAVADCPGLSYALRPGPAGENAAAPPGRAVTPGGSPGGPPRPHPRPGAEPPTKDRRNAEWTWSHHASHALTSAHHLAEQPVLARLLYDVMADPSEDRALDAGVTIAALPFADDAVGVLRRAAVSYPDAPLRHQLSRRLEVGWARPQ